jgi:hypothetical protein
LQWLGHPECPPAEIAAAARDAGFMGRLASGQQGRVFELWWSRGDWSEISDFLDEHPGYQRSAAATYAATYAAAGQHEEGCRHLITTFAIPISPDPAPRELPSIRPVGGDIPSAPLPAARYCMDRGNDVACRRYLAEALTSLAERDQAEFFLVKARLAIHDGNWKEALDDLIASLRASGQI